VDSIVAGGAEVAEGALVRRRVLVPGGSERLA
jgi:hypothetical protein